MEAAARLVFLVLDSLIIPGACLGLALGLAVVVHVAEEFLKFREFRKYQR